MQQNHKKDPQMVALATTAVNSFFNSVYQELLEGEDIVLPYRNALEGIEVGMDDDGDPQLILLKPECLCRHVRGETVGLTRIRFHIYTERDEPCALVKGIAKELIRDRDRAWRLDHPDAPPIKSIREGLTGFKRAIEIKSGI